MGLDFSKINSGQTSNTAINPREIFTALPGKQEGKFEYPRDVQSQVWQKWFERRDETDLVIKMNTGSGKTVVGLSILKSCLNEGKGPAAYVVPDNYLVKQAVSEAHDLGIEVTEDVDSHKFLSGKAILVINIYKLVNGNSVFGVGDEGIKRKIGSLIIDDAHACLDTVEKQFSLEIDSTQKAYEEIFNCFNEALNKQCLVKAYEIKNRELGAYMLVPFWSWQEKQSEILKILEKNKSKDWSKFSWPLIKESLRLSSCVISSNKVEISPHCIPIRMIPSIVHARRKIFMTATLVDDSILCSHFGITEDSINQTITPDLAGDIGDRIILLPQVINSDLNDDDIKEFCKQMSRDFNVVVIVPSRGRANYWDDEADLILDSKNLYEGVSRLKSENVGLTVLVNRYDGIDLPKDACRLLVIDGLPTVRRLIDQVESSIIMGSSRKAAQLVQKIEQGMGRGVRSSDDHCAVFLMGRDLTSQLYAHGAMDKFSPGTKAQIELSEQVTEQIQGKGLTEIREAIMYCLTRNEEWVTASKGRLASLSYTTESKLDPSIIGQRKAFNSASINNYAEAVQYLSEAANSIQEKPLRSYLKQYLAEYINLYDPVEAQKTLMSAAGDNPRVIKPIDGIKYHKLKANGMEQAKVCSDFLSNQFDDPNKIIIEVKGLLDALQFKPGTSEKFEESFKEIARYIGFGSQRPEADFNRGPDVLWEIGQSKYFVIECKNGVTTDTIVKRDCNQLNGSAGAWFSDAYDQTCSCTPIMIHPSVQLEYSASLQSGTRIIDSKRLNLLRHSISDFVKAICVNDKLGDVGFIREQLIHFGLRASDFCTRYTVDFRGGNR
ncbi:helicase [Leptolyngbya valderiana BDU 20041]|nr:helicase [Leptolyngbya valderiana BDU 20041]